MAPEKEPELKYFRVTSLGDVNYDWAPSRQSIIEDMQRMGCLDKDTIVEEVDPKNPTANEKSAVPNIPSLVKPPEEKIEKIFSLPGGQKLKEGIDGKLYSLEWREVSLRELIERCGCEDIEINTDPDTNHKMLDWYELKEEKKEEPKGEVNEDKTDINV